MRLEARWQKLKPVFEEKKVEAVFISSPSNVRYLSGFSGSYAYLLFTPERRYFFTDFRYAEEVSSLKDFYQVVIINRSFLKDFPEFLKKEDLKVLGFESDSLPVSFWEGLKATTRCKLVSLNLDSFRAIKDETELREIKKAVKIAIKAFLKLLPVIKPGLRERDLVVELEYLLRREGSESLPFSPIVASGPNSSCPHARESKRRIKRGDLIKIDWGARSNGYCSDLTRVVHLGKVDEEKDRVFRLVKRAVEVALSVLSDSLKASSVDGKVRLFFKKEKVLPFFGHGLGHGIGLEVHEAPLLNPESRDFLKEGMVFTIEPGLYFPKKFGLRLEEDVYLGPEGIEVLSAKLPRDWFLI